MTLSPLLDELIEAMQCFPGVGPKSAQRMALHAIERDRVGASRLSALLSQALQQVGHCERCNVHTEQPICRLCLDPRRSPEILCVVDSVANMLAIEQSGSYSGRYFVLYGNLSPLDEMGPEEIGLPKLQQRLAQGEVNEVILATSTTVEGEATAHVIMTHITALRRQGIPIQLSRIAYGVPLGGALDMLDANTLGHALVGRRAMLSEFDLVAEHSAAATASQATDIEGAL